MSDVKQDNGYFPVFPAVLGNMSISRFFANPVNITYD
jgi:hypothetical protein